VLAPVLIPNQTIGRTDKRFWQKVDAVFKVPGLTEFVAVVGLIGIRIARPLSESASASDGVAKQRIVPRSISQSASVSDGGIVRYITRKLAAETVSIADSLFGALYANLAESASIGDSVIRIVTRKIVTQTLSVADSIFAPQYVAITESVSASDGISRLAKYKRGLVEGICSILFNGLGPQ
jgi:hypothetical protein